MALKTYTPRELEELVANIASVKAHETEAAEYSFPEAPRYLMLPLYTEATTYKASVYVHPMVSGTVWHTATIFCFEKDGTHNFLFTCGDGFLTGTINKLEAVSRTNKVFSTVEDREAVMTFFGSLTKDSTCSFWSSISANPSKAGCKHVRKMFLNIQASPGGIKDVVLRLIENLGRSPVELKEELGKTVKSPPSASILTPTIPENSAFDVTDPLIRSFETYLGPDVSFKTPVLVLGDQGSSKTFPSRAYGLNRGFEKYVEAGCHSGMEAFDFIGGQVRISSGELIWMDGPVAEAFRSAAAGKKTFLLVDEIYRAPRRERSVFLTALSPHDGKFRLVTGCPINIRQSTCGMTKIAEQEVIEAPVENLSIVATTNVGPDFDIEEDDPAMRERWVMVYRFTNEARLKSILGKIAEAKKFPSDVVSSLISFYNNMKKLKEDNAGAAATSVFVPSTRVLARALQLANTSPAVPALLREFAPTFVDIDVNGRPVESQIKAIHKAIAMAFKLG